MECAKMLLHHPLHSAQEEDDWYERQDTYAFSRDLGAKSRALDAVSVRLEVLVVVGMVLGLGHLCDKKSEGNVWSWEAEPAGQK